MYIRLLLGCLYFDLMEKNVDTKTNRENGYYLTIFPELLSLEQLKDAIRQRLPRLPNLNSMTYDKAVEVYRSMIMPLPQRDYAANARGCIPRQRRLKAESSSSTTTTPPSDRLKPSPSSSVIIRNSTEKNERKKRISQCDGNSDNGTETKPKRQKITWP